MSLFKDTAIALRRLDYSETSQVLVLFGREHGQVRVIAKGIKRSTKARVAVGIDLLERGRVVFSQRSGRESGLSTLTEWRQEDRYAGLRTDLARLYAAQYAAEVTVQLTEPADPHPALFDALDAFFKSLTDLPAVAALCRYLWALLSEIGLRPELSHCRACQRSVEGDRDVFFSAREGGVICRDCEPSVVEKRRLPPVVADAIRAGKWDDEPATRTCFELFDYLLTETMHRPPRLSRMFRQATGLA